MQFLAQCQEKGRPEGSRDTQRDIRTPTMVGFPVPVAVSDPYGRIPHGDDNSLYYELRILVLRSEYPKKSDSQGA